MDEREIAERLAHFYDVTSRHGFESVSAATVYQMFEEFVRPDQRGFTSIKRGLYGRVVNDDIVHLIRLQPIKGASYTLWWGVSLSYVPHEWKRRLRWHRTFRSSQLDLFEIPHVASNDWREHERCVVDTLHGHAHLMRTLHQMWQQLGPEMLDWFSSVLTVQDILAKAFEQMQRRWAWHHFPDPSLIYVFTLARVGRTEEAQAALETYFNSIWQEPPEAQANLKQALAKVAAL